MTSAEARIRRRLFGALSVRVSIGGEMVFEDEDVVKMRRSRDGVRIWTYWTGKWTEPELREWWYPRPDEVMVER